jgi:glycerol-3-phosphate dehydrogenase (NAD(P)+)
MNFCIIGGGSWATALAKMLTDNGNRIGWWLRSQKQVDHIRRRHHNPQYLSSVYFNTDLLCLSTKLNEVLAGADTVVVCVPSSYLPETFSQLSPNIFDG